MNCATHYYWVGKPLDHRIFHTRNSRWSVVMIETSIVSQHGDGHCMMVRWLHVNTDCCIWPSPPGAEQPVHTRTLTALSVRWRKIKPTTLTFNFKIWQMGIYSGISRCFITLCVITGRVFWSRTFDGQITKSFYHREVYRLMVYNVELRHSL